MAVFEEFFLSRKSNVARLELLEFSHPSFSQVYRIVRNMLGGVTVTLPDPDNVQATFQFYPVRIQRQGQNGTMDSSLNITFGDLSDVIPKEIERIMLADTFNVTPKVRYWAYRSDDLTKPIYGPSQFEITAMPYTKEGFSATATAPQISVSGTGEIYTLERFPMLRGFL